MNILKARHRSNPRTQKLNLVNALLIRAEACLTFDVMTEYDKNLYYLSSTKAIIAINDCLNSYTTRTCGLPEIAMWECLLTATVLEHELFVE